MTAGVVDGPVRLGCGRTLDRARVVELGQTPGVFICGGCAQWAARRARGLSIPVVVRTSWERLRTRRAGSTAMAAIPILPSGDLAVTEAFYSQLGFEVAGRYDGYLLLHVRDATVYWKQLRERGMPGVSDPEQKDYGLVEFVVTDSSGNAVRFGSPVG